MRILFEFVKGARLRFVSLLDMQRLMQRALRRSGLPIRYSGGYSPHAAMSFASALGLGVWSTCEILDVKMESECPLQEAFERMNAALPADMRITRVSAVADGHPASMARLSWADYEIIFEPAQARIATDALELLAQAEIMAMRKTKSGEKETDVRPLIATLAAQTLADGRAVLRARLRLCEQGTLKPELLIQLAAAQHGVEYNTGDAEIIRRALLTGDDASTARPIITDGVLATYPG